jgi:hypothetical protein
LHCTEQEYYSFRSCNSPSNKFFYQRNKKCSNSKLSSVWCVIKVCMLPSAVAVAQWGLDPCLICCLLLYKVGCVDSLVLFPTTSDWALRGLTLGLFWGSSVITSIPSPDSIFRWGNS